MVMIMMMLILIILFFTIQDTNLYTPVVLLSAEDIQKLSKHLRAKGLKDQCIQMNIKKKRRIKIWQTRIDIFSNQTL